MIKKLCCIIPVYNEKEGRPLTEMVSIQLPRQPIFLRHMSLSEVL